jgi:hypothetical protein
MFTVLVLHQHPTIVKVFMGIPAEAFWMIVEVATLMLPQADRQWLERLDRQRAYGAGRGCDQPVALRVAAVLTYLRLHAPQMAVALMYGMTQTDISRDLRRVLPAIQKALPCPQVWKALESGQELSETAKLTLEELG